MLEIANFVIRFDFIVIMQDSIGNFNGLFEKLGSIEFSIAEMYGTGSISKVNILFCESK